MSQDPYGSSSGSIPQWPAPNIDFSSSVPSYSSGQPDLAGWWQRVGAHILDSIFVGLLMIPGMIVLVGLWAVFPQRTYTLTPDVGEPTSFQGPTTGYIVLLVVVGVVWFIGTALYYYGYLQGKGATWGKKAVGIRVVDSMSGQPIGFWRALGRWFVPWLLGTFTLNVLTLLDFLWPLWDKQNQAIHDKMFNSLVVKSR